MKAILFDFGGTIDTDGVHWSEKFWEMYKRFTVPVEKKAFEHIFVRAEDELAKDVEMPAATFKQTLYKQFTLQFGFLNLQEQESLRDAMVEACYEDVRQTIERAKSILLLLKQKYTLGVVSNFYGNLDIVCNEFGLEPFFSSKIDSANVGFRKPDPSIFDCALKELHVSPLDTFVVGDSYDRDIVPAKSLGCYTVWLKGKSWMEPVNTEAADFTINKFEEIKTIFLDQAHT